MGFSFTLDTLTLETGALSFALSLAFALTLGTLLLALALALDLGALLLFFLPSCSDAGKSVFLLLSLPRLLLSLESLLLTRLLEEGLSFTLTLALQLLCTLSGAVLVRLLASAALLAHEAVLEELVEA
jgi:hypothetical protein